MQRLGRMARKRVFRAALAFGEVAKILGEKWKSLDAEEKAKYQAMADQDKVPTTYRVPPLLRA